MSEGKSTRIHLALKQRGWSLGSFCPASRLPFGFPLSSEVFHFPNCSRESLCNRLKFDF